MKKYTGLEIAVIGLAGRFPKADNIEQYWDNLKNGKDCISELTGMEIKNEGEQEALLEKDNYVKANAFLEGKQHFDAAFFGYRPDEATLMDPQIRIFHECCWEALEDSGYGTMEQADKIGIFATATPNLNWSLYALHKNQEGLVDDFSLSQLSDVSFLSSRISYKLNLKGPAIFLQTACSSSLVAIHEACNSLLLGECTMALAGGVTVNNYSRRGYLYEKGMIYSRDGKCRPFDVNSGGTVGGEGAGVVVLKRLKDAIRDRDNIYGVIKGTGLNNDGNNKVGYTAPGIEGQVNVIRRAYKMAGIEPESISYVEAHGTATELGDVIEIDALNEVYGNRHKNTCAIGSVKSNIGHLDSAAGVAGFIKTVLALKHRQLPPSIHFEQPNPRINFDNGPFYVNNGLKSWDKPAGPLRAAISSFGIGGTNAHLVLEEAPPKEVNEASRTHQLMVLSAQTKESLSRNCDKLLQTLRKDDVPSLADIAYTLNKGRERFKYRKVLVCKDKEEAINILSRIGDSEPVAGSHRENLRNVVFMFSGQGSQYREMCRDLYTKEPFFRDQLDQCFEIARNYTEVNLKNILFSEQEPTDTLQSVNNTRYTQPLLFFVEYAIAQLFINWEIKPDYMIGHSIGEYVAACVSGAFSLNDAVKLVVSRGQLIAGLEGGSMLSVDVEKAKLQELLRKFPGIDIAAINSDKAIVVAGAERDITSFESYLVKEGFKSKLLYTSHAFHSSMMEAAMKSFEEIVSSIPVQEPRIPYVSNLTGEIVRWEELKNPTYWSNHLRHTVQFSKGVKWLAEQGDAVFIEMGPGRSLCNFLNNNAAVGTGHLSFNTISQRNQQVDDTKYLLEKLGQLWLAGVKINWDNFYEKEERRRVSLPTYSFERKNFIADVNAFDLWRHRVSDKTSRFEFRPEDSIHQFHWQIKPVAEKIHALAEREECFLIFSDKEGFSDELSAYLELQGQKVIMVNEGTGFRKTGDTAFALNYGNPDDFAALWDAISEMGYIVSQIVYCPAITSQPGIADYEHIDAYLSHGYLGLSYLAKSIATVKYAGEINITVIDNFLAAITKEEEINPLKAAIHGPSRVMPLEATNVRCKVIDLSFPYKNGESSKDYLSNIVGEIFSTSNEPFVAYRFKQRWVRAFNVLTPENNTKSGISIEKGGTYLLTGGLGGMGLTIAHDLVISHDANVILVHRSEFPDKSAWAEWLAKKGTKDEISRRIIQLQEMLNTGRRVELIQADISDEQDVIRLSKKVKMVSPKIDGLIWAAGEIDYSGIIANRDRKALIKPVSSKIHGVLLFEKYFSFGEMAFISLFSSIGNVLYYPKFGQAGYNAANEFLENYSYYLKRRYNIHAFAINWCDWKSVGMTVKARMRDAHSDDVASISEQITDGITPRQGALVFNECLKYDCTTTTVYRENIARSIESQRKTYNDIKAGLQKQLVPSENQPETESKEELLLQLFSSFFGKHEIGMDDDFFELGGDSLMGMTFVARINQLFHTDLSITDIYKYPSPGLLLSQFKDGQVEGEWAKIPKAQEKDYYQLSSPQRRMYFLQTFDKESVAYNENIIFWLKGSLDKEKFNAAIDKIIMRHEILRTSFRFEGGVPVQQVLSNFDFKVVYDKCAAADLEEIVTAFIRPFDLGKGPLMRIGVYEVQDDRHLVIFDMHHIIMDGISKAILMNEFVSLYGGADLPNPVLQYKDYAEWQQSEGQRAVTAAHKAFWLAQFEDEPSILQLPIDFERPAVKNNEGRVANFMIATPDVKALKAVAEDEGVSMFMLLLSAYYVLLSKLSNQEDIIVGTPTAGRPHADLENMMGMFVNMVPLRNKPAADLTFREFLLAVKTNSLDFLANQNFQYEELIEAIKMERDLSRNPLFDVVFSHENFKFPEVNMDGLEIEDFNSDSIVSKFDLRLTTVEKSDNIYGTFEYSTRLFKSETIDRFVGHFLQVVHTIVHQRDIRIADIELVSNEERRLILHAFNNTRAKFAEKKLITDLFEEQVARTPFSTAVIAGGVDYSYQWLNEASNRLANLLRASGVVRESSVVVVMERNIELPAVLLAILKAGGKYVPVEPYLPANRVGVILKSVQAQCIITNKHNHQFVDGLLEQSGLPCTGFSVDVNENRILEVNLLENRYLQPVNLYEFDSGNLTKLNQSEDLAYIIFTSGSTGDPKGVAVQHKPVINLIEWVNITYDINENDKVLFVTSVSFDLSVYDVFGILAAGGVIRMANRAELEDPDLLAHIITEEEITFWDSAPAMLQQVLPFLENRKLAASDRGRLRLAFLSGDWIPLTMPPQMTAIFKNLRFIALGGATEATVWSNYFEVKEIDPAWKSIPYGKPIQNAKYYILNKSMNVCPVGVTGDLYIGDLCLAEGYFNDPVLSGNKFIPSPFEEGGILYKTGDLARWFPDGNMEFLGRSDSQIKIRGYRIELGEIERKLIEFDGIEQVLVQVFSKTRYDNFVCAFYVSADPLSEEAMREFLAKDLPIYMVPKFFIRIDKIPVTKNGKIDRKMLPSPELYAKTENIAKPVTEIQQALAKTWAELLGVDEDQIGIRDDFFGLGGHSIMAVHLINVIKQQFGVGIKLRKIFENPTIEKLAKVIETGRVEESGSVGKTDNAQTYPLSHAQERLYYAQMLNKDSISHNVYGVYQIKGDVDFDRLERSFQLLVDRHEGLRTSFLMNPEGLAQRINSRVQFKLRRLESRPFESFSDAFDSFVEPFDLAAPSLIRGGLLKKDGINLLFVDIHHIVCDGISLNILMNDFKDLYMGSKLLPLPLRYVDYARWQRSSPACNEEQRMYWSRKLSGELTEIQLPVIQDSSKIDIQHAVIKTLEIAGEDVERIQRMLATSNVSGYMFFLSLFYVLLHKVSGNSDIIVGTDVIGRTSNDLKDVVGTFINMLPMRINIDPADTFEVLLEEVKDVVLEGFENQDYQYDQIISDLVQEGRLPRRFIATHFAFVSYFGQPVHLDGLHITPYEQRLKETTTFEFKLEVREAAGKYYLLFVFSEELFTDDIMDMLVSYYSNIMYAVLMQSNSCIEDISVEKMVLS